MSDEKMRDVPMSQSQSQSESKSECPSLSSLPDEIIVDCLARVSKSNYNSLCSVSKSFYSLLSSPEIYAARSRIGTTEPRLYVCLWLPENPNRQSWFFLRHVESESELSLVPLAKLSSSYPRARNHSTSVSVGSQIYQMGGITVDNKLSRAVFVIDCRSNTWRRGPSLTVARTNAKSCFLDGKIYVIGGCRKKDEPLDWGEVFDLKTQSWNPLPCPSRHELDPNDRLVVFGGKLYVFTKTNLSYAYDPQGGRWLVLDGGGFVGLEPATIAGPCCVIDGVMFAEFDRKYKWYNPRYREWFIVYGLDLVYENRRYNYTTLQLVNHGGKLVIIWLAWFPMFRKKNKIICCAVVRLEERSGPPQLWGVVERRSVIVPTVYKPPCNLSTCQSTSV